MKTQINQPRSISPATSPVTVINTQSPSPLLLVCDHASRNVPPELDLLGLAPDALNLHIAYDIGAESVTRNMSATLNLTAVLANYSRLVIDLNRPLGHPESIPMTSDTIPVPANQDLSEKQKRARATSYFEPYHDTINETLAHIWNAGTPPALFSIHSFTPEFDGFKRPWEVGILWNRDPRIALPLMERLKAHGLSVGDNEPYSGRDHLAYTIDMHGGAAGLANCAIEIRQDLITDEKGVQQWSEILSAAFKEIIELEGIFKVHHF